MTYKNTKTILFASLIVAMILPFSGMQSVDATHVNGEDHTPDKTHLPIVLPIPPQPTVYNYEEKQQNLVNMLLAIELRIENARNDTLKENLELIKQRILAKLLEASLYENGAITLMGPFLSGNPVIDPNFSIEGDHLGCNGEIESWTYEGALANNQPVVLISQDFPNELTSGGPQDCAISAWANNVHLTIQPAFFGEGCQGVLDIESTFDYALDCQNSVTSGLYIVGITFNYANYTETKYTYVDV